MLDNATAIDYEYNLNALVKVKAEPPDGQGRLNRKPIVM